MTPGSTSPERVPITRPSIGVSPIDVSIGRPPTIADADAPLPRCSTIWFSDSSGASEELGRLLADVLVRRAVEPVAANVPLRGHVSVDGVGRGGGGQVVEERRVEHRDVRHVRQHLAGDLDAEDRGRIVQRRQRRQLCQRARSTRRRRSSAGTGRGRRAPRGGRRRPDPSASRSSPPRRAASNAARSAASWSVDRPSSPMRSTIPSAS